MWGCKEDMWPRTSGSLHTLLWPSLNLAAGDTLKRCKLMKDTLETTRDITKLIKYSHEEMEYSRETMPVGSTPGIRILCPTRWTVHAESIHSILTNYGALQKNLG